MARKRVDRSKAPTSRAQNGSSMCAVKGRVNSSQNPGIDCSSVARGVALLSVALAITGFLVYPDISRVISKVGFSGFSADSSEPSRMIRNIKDDVDTLTNDPVHNSEQLFQHTEDVIDDKSLMSFHDDDEDVNIEDGQDESTNADSVGDLMEDELIEKRERESRETKTLRSPHKVGTGGKDDKSDPEGQPKAAFDEDDMAKIPRRPGKGKNDPPPVIIRPGSGPVTLDPSQMRFVDTPTKVKSPNTKKNTVTNDSKSSRNIQDSKAQIDINSENKTAELNSPRTRKPTISKQTAKLQDTEQPGKLDSKQTTSSELNDKQSSAKASSISPESQTVSGSSKKFDRKQNNNKQKNEIPPVQGRPGRDKNAPPPIVLKPGSGPITLSSSQMRFEEKHSNNPSNEKHSKDSTIESTSSGKSEQSGNLKHKPLKKTHTEPTEPQGSIKKMATHKRSNNHESKDVPKQSTNKNQEKTPTPVSSGQTKKKTISQPTAKHTTESSSSKKPVAVNRQDNKNNKQKAETIEKDTDNTSNKFKARYQKTLAPKKVFIDGRRIPPTELLHQKPSNSSVKVYLFNDFLSDQECDGLIRAHDSHMQALNHQPLLCFDSIATLRSHLKAVKKSIRVTPNDFTTGTKCLNSSLSAKLQTWLRGNWSYSTAFYPGESRFSNVLAARLDQAMGLGKENGGKFQITSYPLGKAYKEHTDCVIGGTDRRDRVASVLMYLNDAEDGGETSFPDLGIWVKPKKGRALLWNNMSPDGFCEPHSKHVAKVVKKGSKYILIRWYYYKNFYALGKRQAAPEFPARDELQPLVMCDQYNMGSCRWYDEWTNDVLVDYQNNKVKLH